MQFVLFLILYPILWLISIMPFRMLYIFSDCVYFVVYRVIGYRKSVVRQNLEMALPHLTPKQRLVIERKSYHHLCDIFLEMIKTMSISERELNKRFVFTNLDLYRKMEAKQKSIALFCAHYASYEWAVSMNNHISFNGYAIYKRIANRYFDKLVRDIRSKYKAYLITTKETIPMIQRNQAAGILGAYGFASDQSPKASKAHHWAMFMGIRTPVHTGAEMLAKKFDMNVIFMRTKKLKRGYYEATFEELVENPREVPDYQITDLFLKSVERQIYEAPEFYLWTHKRWKYKK